ncbi:MAG: RNA polymerase sigma factor [Rhizobiaceae bacterium]|nr:RNA polymerase sigma factor [Rhizobiaceae bacterium]
MADRTDEILALMPALRRYAASLSRSRQDADDLVQDSMEAAFAHLGDWRGVNLRGWLMTIVTNMHRRRYRSTAGRTQLAALDEAGEVAAPAALGDPLERDRLAAAIDLLPPEQRSVLMLVVVEGYAYAEVAGMLEIPVGTVMSRLSRARRAVAQTMEGRNVIGLRRPG